MIEQTTELAVSELPRIVAFDRAKPHCWSCMPEMLERIGKFAEQYCNDTEPEFLMQSVMQDFTSPKPGFFILGALSDEYKIIGHLLACISVPAWSQKRRCLILQYQLDQGLPMGLIRAGFDMVIDWGKTQYCHAIIAETKTEEARRVFTTFHQFQIDLVQVTRAL